ncbi:MAG: GAF domain-containing protein, partial [Solirubrobacterales bacterium]|nr:GAF domain-containing protein [Solirubrobacterales bacterium]
NAMAKLGATTRSQAVVIAMQRDEIDSAAVGAATAARARPVPASVEIRSALEQMLGGLVSLYDVDGGVVYLSDADGLSLRQVAGTGGAGFDLPEVVALGDGTLGRAALERRAQLVNDDRGSSRGTLIVAPILAGGRLVGVIAFAARVSRPVGRSELLLLQAFSNRVGEVIAGGGDVERQLGVAMDRFRTSWSAGDR